MMKIGILMKNKKCAVIRNTMQYIIIEYSILNEIKKDEEFS